MQKFNIFRISNSGNSKWDKTLEYKKIERDLADT